jgi:uncharacterized phiE125 gp8 family phage protein
MIRLEAKRPSEVRRLAHDWSDFLGAADVQSQVTTATGATIDSSSIDGTNAKIVRFQVSGGVENVPALITQTIVSTDGDTETETFQLPIKADEPVSLAEAIAQVRGIAPGEEALLASNIRSARIFVESESGWVLQRREFTEHFRRWNNYIELGRRPVISVDEITYHDDSGTIQPYVGFFPVVEQAPARVYPIPGQSFPTLGHGGLVSVTYTAGFAEGDIAEPLELGRQAILLLVAHWYANREPVSDRPANEIPMTVAALIDRFRVPVA